MRGSIDDLALMVAGAPPAQGALLAQQQQSYPQPGDGHGDGVDDRHYNPSFPAAYPGHPGYPQQLSQFQQQPQFQQHQFQPQQQFQQQFQQQQSYADQSEETEIMWIF